MVTTKVAPVVVLMVSVARGVIGNADPIAVIKTYKSGKSVVTNSVSIGGQRMELVVNLNSPDLIVPICNTTNCYKPGESGSFGYCAGTDQCFDRSYPPYQCTRLVPSSEWSIDTSVYTDHSIPVEGVDLKVSTFEFHDSNVVIQANETGREIKIAAPVKGAVGISRGFLGLGPQRLSCRNETWLSASGAGYVEFDQGSISLYHNTDSIAWPMQPAERFQLVPTNDSALRGTTGFNIYNPTVCGQDVLGSVSSRWSAIIDLTRECLVVPDFVMKNVAAWRAGSDNQLYFYLNCDKGRVPVALDLSKSCIEVSQAAVNHDLVGITALNPIVIGSQAVAAIGKVGFQTFHPYHVLLPVNPESPTRFTCTTAIPQCVGQQVYFASSNRCGDPECDRFRFSELDEESHTCEWRPYVKYAFTSMIAILVIGEVVLFRLNKQAIRWAQMACQRDVSIHG